MVEKIRMKNIIKRGQTYYFRLRIPEDLQEHFERKKEICKSLKTRDPMKAMDKRDEMLEDYQSQFRELRAIPESSSPVEHPEFDLEAFAQRFEQKVMTAARDTVDNLIIMPNAGMKVYDEEVLKKNLKILGDMLYDGNLSEIELKKLGLNPLGINPHQTIHETCKRRQLT